MPKLMNNVNIVTIRTLCKFVCHVYTKDLLPNHALHEVIFLNLPLLFITDLFVTDLHKA